MYNSMKSMFYFAISTPGRSLPGRRRWWLKDRTLGQEAVASGWRLQRFPILAVLSLAVTFVMSSWQLTTRCALRRSGWRSLDGRTLKTRETVFQSRSFIMSRLSTRWRRLSSSMIVKGKEEYNSRYEFALDQEWEFPRDLLELGPVLGEGAFGKVSFFYSFYSSEN